MSALAPYSKLLATALAACGAVVAALATEDADPVARFAETMMRDLAVEAMDCATRRITVGDSGVSSNLESSALPDPHGLRERGMRALCGYRLHIDPDRFRRLWESGVAGAHRAVSALPEGPWEPLGGGLTGRAYRLDETLFTVGVSSLRGQGPDASLSGVVLIFLFADRPPAGAPRTTAPPASR